MCGWREEGGAGGGEERSGEEEGKREAEGKEGRERTKLSIGCVPVICPGNSDSVVEDVGCAFTQKVLSPPSPHRDTRSSG